MQKSSGRDFIVGVFVLAGLLGDQFVSLEPGAEDALLAPGELFTYTESALSLDKLVGRLVHGDALGDD